MPWSNVTSASAEVQAWKPLLASTAEKYRGNLVAIADRSVHLGTQENGYNFSFTNGGGAGVWYVARTVYVFVPDFVIGTTGVLLDLPSTMDAPDSGVTYKARLVYGATIGTARQVIGTNTLVSPLSLNFDPTPNAVAAIDIECTEDNGAASAGQLSLGGTAQALVQLTRSPGEA